MLTLKIISPAKIFFNGTVDRVLVPGEKGDFEILVNHAPIISTLVAGKVVYTINASQLQLDILGGFVEVQKNEVNLCVEI